MSRIIRESRFVESTAYSLEFDYRNHPGSGFSFPCDSKGNVDRSKLQPAGIANLDKCLSGEYDVERKGIRTEITHYREPALLECNCGAKVELSSSWANECEHCHTEFNGSGQQLAPREQWGEETGERF